MQAYSSALDFDGRARGLRGEVLKRSWLAEERHHRGGWLLSRSGLQYYIVIFDGMTNRGKNIWAEIQ